MARSLRRADRASQRPSSGKPGKAANSDKAGKSGKMGKAGKKGAAPDRGSRIEQIKGVWAMTRKSDPKLIPYVVAPAVAVLVVFVVVGLLVGPLVLFAVAGVLVAVMVGTTIFGRRATSTMYSQVEGRAGAAAAVLQGMRGDWRVTPAVAFTRNQDLVHRVIGRPGIVLVGEGSSVSAIRQLVVDQKRKVGRVAPDTPVYDVIVGDGDGRVPVRKLQQHMTKLPRSLKQKDINLVENRMRAIGGTSAPMPKGPIPTRVPRGRMR